MGRAEEFEKANAKRMARTTGGDPSIPSIVAAAPVILAHDSGTGRSKCVELGCVTIDMVEPDPNQPRKTFPADNIAALAASLKRNGQLFPLRVRWNTARGKWIIIAGERRYRALLLAGITKVDCRFIDRDMTAAELLEEQLVENVHREDLRPIEAARGYQTLMALHDWTAATMSEVAGKAAGQISKSLALLKLPEECQALIDAHNIAASSAYELTKLATAEDQIEMARRLAAGDMTRAEVADKVKERRTGAGRGETTLGPAKEKPETGVPFHHGDVTITISMPSPFDRRKAANALAAGLQSYQDELGQRAA